MKLPDDDRDLPKLNAPVMKQASQARRDARKAAIRKKAEEQVQSTENLIALGILRSDGRFHTW